MSYFPIAEIFIFNLVLQIYQQIEVVSKEKKILTPNNDFNITNNNRFTVSGRFSSCVLDR